MTLREFQERYKEYRVTGHRYQYYVRAKDWSAALGASLAPKDSWLFYGTKDGRVLRLENIPRAEVIDRWETLLLALKLSGEVECL
jgi:hypothetical protein